MKLGRKYEGYCVRIDKEVLSNGEWKLDDDCHYFFFEREAKAFFDKQPIRDGVVEVVLWKCDIEYDELGDARFHIDHDSDPLDIKC